MAGGRGPLWNDPKNPSVAELSVWDVSTRKKLVALEGHTNSVWSVALRPDGKTLASGSLDKTVRLWDVATGKELATLKDSPCGVSSIAFSPDGKTLAGSVWVCYEDGMWPDWSKPGRVLLWDVATQKVRATLKVDVGAVLQLAFSPDGKTLATTTRKWDAKRDYFVSGEVWFWDAATGKHTGTLKAHTTTISAFAYSPDGKTLATGGDTYEDAPDDGCGRSRVKLWDAATLKLLASEPLLQSYARGLAFSSDGKALVLGSTPLYSGTFVSYGEVVIVETGNLKVITKLPCQDWFGGAAFRPNSKVLATTDYRQIKLWELPGKR